MLSLMRARFLVPMIASSVVMAAALALVPPASAAPGPTPYTHRLASPHVVDRGRTPITVGGLTLKPCGVVAHAYCGHIARHWEPGNPTAGRVRVGFAFVPARDDTRPALGTYVPHEGGPGYSTTGTGASYAAMYGGLLRRHNLLLVDQRGTGRSEAIDCPAGDVAARRRCVQLAVVALGEVR